MKSLRWSVPVMTGWRGAGLGNEVFSWAKAYIAAQELDLRLIPPRWSFNPRGYRKDFGTPAWDAVPYIARHVLPTYRIDTPEIARGSDYAEIVRSVAHQVPSGPVAVLHPTGMSGGYASIARAREYLSHQLLRPKSVGEHLYLRGPSSPRPLRVAVHIRLGDFDEESAPVPGAFSRAIPLQWYEQVIGSISDQSRGDLRFTIFTDSPSDRRLRKFVRVGGGQRTVISDERNPLVALYSMVNADLLICSISSMSLLAAFLSDKPYIWYQAHLRDDEGWGTIWGHEASQAIGQTQQNLQSLKSSHVTGPFRGYAMDGSSNLPTHLLTYLDERAWLLDTSRDLVYYGGTPIDAASDGRSHSAQTREHTRRQPRETT